MTKAVDTVDIIESKWHMLTHWEFTLCVSMVSTVPTVTLRCYGPPLRSQWTNDMIRVTLRCFLVCMLKINIPSNVSQCPACWVINNYQWLSCHCINIPLGLEFSYRLTSFLAFGLAVKLSVTDGAHHTCKCQCLEFGIGEEAVPFQPVICQMTRKFLGKKLIRVVIPCMRSVFLCKTTQVLAHHLADRPNHWPWEVYESRNETQTGDDMENIGKIEDTLASTHSVKENWRGSAQCLVARHSTCRNGWVL